MYTILVIDDDPIMRETISDILSLQGYKVILASSGVQAMLHLQNVSVNLIITDVIMPDKDGIEVIMVATKEYPQVKILAISGGGYISADNYLKMASSLGAHSTLVKPFDIDDLVGKVNNLIGNVRHRAG